MPICSAPRPSAIGAVKARRHRGTKQLSEDGPSETTLALDDKGRGSWDLDLKQMLHLGDAAGPATATWAPGG